MKKIILFLGIACGLVSCLEVLELNHDNSDPVLVVEGLITDKPGPYTVRLSTTVSFNLSQRSNPVEDAIVTISDDLGNQEILNYVENGRYETTSMQGMIGRTYYLDVAYGGVNYKSQSTLLPVSAIDTLYSTFEKATRFIEGGYYLSIGAKSANPNLVNYFRWKVYEADSLYNGVNDIMVARDDYFEGEFVFQFGYPFEIGDTVKVEMYSLNKDAYDYYQGFVTILQSDGGLFSPPPVNAPSNISERALGIFQACSVVSEEVIIAK